MKLSFVAFSVIVAFFATSRCCAVAQSILSDGTTSTKPANCSADCFIEGGLQQGNNLFHSFERFNVDARATVLFQDPGVANILARVTGNKLSEILGTLGVSGGDANLFLLNPNGIIFGQDSSLNLNGSFLATTANAIKFGDQGLLETVLNNIPLLTINPSALSFANRNQGVIRNESIAPAGADISGIEETALGLRVPDGKSFLLVGGDVVFDGGRVNAFGGRVELGGLAKAGEIELNFSDFNGEDISLSFSDQIQRSNVFLTNEALINVPADDGGTITINANSISIAEGSLLRAGFGFGLGTPESQAGDINLDATNKLEITNGSSVTNQVLEEAQGSGGNIIINADSLFISNQSDLQALTFGSGDAGNIEIDVSNGAVEIINESKVTAVVDSIEIDDIEFIGIGDGGDIKITAQELLLEDSSFIDASTLGQGNAGNIDLFLEESLVIDIDSGIQSIVNPGAIGDAGSITIESNRISLESGSQLAASVLGSGEGGDISLNVVDLINISGFGTDGFPSGLITETTVGAEGQAGDITVNTNNFRIADGAIVSSQTFNESNGGNISLNIDTFEAVDGGQVLTSTDNVGNAGSINVQASDSLLLIGSDSNLAERVAEFGEETVGNELPGNSGFFANVRSDASGTGGNINVEAGQLDIFDNAEINVNAAGLGVAGSIGIDAQEITLDRGSLTAETRVGDQGNITLNNTDTLLLRNNSQITTNATESATGGDISIESSGIALLDNSDITANAVQGQGGDIQITTQGIFQEPDSQITAASELGIDGTVTFNTPDVDPASGIFELPDVPIDAERILAQDLCKLEDDKIAKGSSFIITGRGGLTSTSEGSLENRDRIVNWASRDDLEVSNNGLVGVRQRPASNTSSAKKHPVIQQSHGLVATSDGSVWLVANTPETTLQNSGIDHPDCRTLQEKR